MTMTYLLPLASAICVNSWSLSRITDPFGRWWFSHICSSYDEDSALDSSEVEGGTVW